MTRPLRFTVPDDEAGRADSVVARRFPGTSRRRLADLFRDGHVRINGSLAKKGSYARAGAEVTVASPPLTDEDLRPKPEPNPAIELLHQDAQLIAVAKPPGVPTYPLRAGERGTVANALVARFPECLGIGDDPREAGLAHRLDVGTSGVLLAARDQETWTALRAMFGDDRIDKEYVALVAGEAEAGSCEKRLSQRGKRAVLDGLGLAASTSWSVLERGAGSTLLRCVARGGRMHQVRVHLAHTGFPIVGDTLYGGPSANGLTGHFLHAARIALDHPSSGDRLVIDAPLGHEREADLRRLIAGFSSS